MTTKVGRIELVQAVEAIALPDGDYPGKWGGYLVEAVINGRSCRFHTVNGIRGMDIPCTVRVRGGEVLIDVD